MTQLQELITRARFLLSAADKRREVFKLINGKRTAKDIATKTGRSFVPVLHDIEKLKDLELIENKKDKEGNVVKRHGSSIYEKVPLIKHVSLSYFQEVSKTSKITKGNLHKKVRSGRPSSIHIPSEQEILDICRTGEDQLYEFKSPGTAVDKITKEIAAFLHTKYGGILFYGVDDDGTIIGSDKKRQDFDQSLQNSIRNTLSHQPNIEIKEKNVMGSKILVVVIPPWDRTTLYQHTKTEKHYIRKGTNVFALKSDELEKLFRGEYVV